MIMPSPEILRKYRNTDSILKSNRSNLLSDLITRYPNDYLDLETYEAIKRAMQFP